MCVCVCVCVYLLVEATVESTPADLHQALGGDQNLVGPLPCRETGRLYSGFKGTLRSKTAAAVHLSDVSHHTVTPDHLV